MQFFSSNGFAIILLVQNFCQLVQNEIQERRIRNSRFRFGNFNNLRLPPHSIIDLNKMSYWSWSPNSACMNDNDSHSNVKGHAIDLKVIAKQDTSCISMYESRNCLGANLQFLEVTNEKILKLNTPGIPSERLLNFNFMPKSFQPCINTESKDTLFQKYCMSTYHVDMKINGRPRTMGIKECKNIPRAEPSSGVRPQVEIFMKPDDPAFAKANSPEALCIELYSEMDCRGGPTRLIIPSNSPLAQASSSANEGIKIWEYFSGQDGKPNVDPESQVLSVKRCSICSPSEDEKLNKQAQAQKKMDAAEPPKHLPLMPSSQEGENCFKDCLPVKQEYLSLLRSSKQERSEFAPECYYFFETFNCSHDAVLRVRKLSPDQFLETFQRFSKHLSKWWMGKCIESDYANYHASARCFKGNPKFEGDLHRYLYESEQSAHRSMVEIVVLCVASSLAVIMLIVVIVLSYLLWRKRRRLQEARKRCVPMRQTLNADRSLNVHQIDPVEANDYEDDITGLNALCRSITSAGFEIPREAIDIGNIRDSTAPIIGMGDFTIAFRGRLPQSSNRTVVVKSMKSCQATARTLKSFLRECQVFMQLGKHDHILEFIGVCTENVRAGNILMVMEHCELGSLKSFLMQQRTHFVNLLSHEEIGNDDRTLQEARSPIQRGPPVRFNTFQLFKWCWEVSDAMEFLSVRKVVHMSLSTKNVLLDSNFSCKISDFYYARTPDDNGSSAATSTYNCRANTNKDRLIPWRWFAIESLLDDVFTVESDVWTFGVFMWEVFTMGATPYPEYIYGGEFTLCIKHGYRLLKPPFATIQSYELMLLCWYDAPEKRPTFTKIKSKLASMMTITS